MGNLQVLQAGATMLQISMADSQQQKLLQYVSLLHKWNKVYNLTAIRNTEEMVSHHLLDSVAVLPHLWSGRWLDVGCGAGLPGLVLAIMRPDWQFVLLDSNSKKTGFVQQAIIALELKNVSVVCARVETYADDRLFDGITSRAFSELGDFIKVTDHLLLSGGRWAAMKGWAEKELDKVPAHHEVDKVVTLHVPGLNAARSLVVVSRRERLND